VLPRDAAIAAIKRAAKKTYGAKGDAVVQANYQAIDAALDAMKEVPAGRPDLKGGPPGEVHRGDAAAEDVPEFVQRVTLPIIAGRGNDLPVSAMPVDGTYPTGTAKYEKRNIADEIPVWDAPICIQCNKCVFVCPHAALRVKVFEPQKGAGAPAAFKSIPYRGAEFEGFTYAIQVAPEDCTGCDLCVQVCPAKSKTSGQKALVMAAQAPLLEQERANFAFFLTLPEADRAKAKAQSVKGSQFLEPLFEFSGACAGCGEAPYLKLVSQLFGDRMLVANATGCSSIFGGNLPTTPWTVNKDGLGPAWANSLFEDNAEFGLGLRLSVDQHVARARALVHELAPELGEGLADAILNAPQQDEPGIFEQRRRVQRLKEVLGSRPGAKTAALLEIADYLVKKTVWIVGGDGWAYDIGYGGLDHVLASGADVNVLVLDSEVYSNTGGQASKATPRAAVARFASAGKRTGKKDLGLLAMTYGHVYVAHVAFGANDTQTVRAFLEAESYPGPSLIIGYAHCIAHGIDISRGLSQQRKAVASGHWPLFRFDPRQAAGGVFPLTLDSKGPAIPFTEYAYEETRYRSLTTIDPDAAARLASEAAHDIVTRWKLYETLSRR
jgi:pyruvate-ferredoxin/flavodoxin oxidoreductase